MAEKCPSCNSTDVIRGLGQAHCLGCGKYLDHSDNLGFKVAERDGIDLPGPADSSLATPTSTPVYAEDTLTRKPVLDTNQQAVKVDAPPGPPVIPDSEASEEQGVAGELSDDAPADEPEPAKPKKRVLR